MYVAPRPPTCYMTLLYCWHEDFSVASRHWGFALEVSRLLRSASATRSPPRRPQCKCPSISLCTHTCNCKVFILPTCRPTSRFTPGQIILYGIGRFFKCLYRPKSALSNAFVCERFQTPVDCVGRVRRKVSRVNAALQPTDGDDNHSQTPDGVLL